MLLAVVVTPGDDAAAPAAPKRETAGVEAADDQTQAADWREGKHEWHAGKPRMVNVVGLREGGGGELSDCNSQDLSMLLRLQGPEALAEVREGVLALQPRSSARPVPGCTLSCVSRFLFLQLDGAQQRVRQNQS